MRTNKAHGEAPDDAFAALKSVVEVGAVFVALAFVTGWSYMASYYTQFGLNPFELDFSVPSIAAFAIHVLRRSGWALPAALIFLVLLAGFYPRLGKARRAWAGACVAILLFSFAIVGARRGRAVAAEDMLDTTRNLPDVGFLSKEPEALRKQRLEEGLEPACLGGGIVDCKLLLHAKSTYYFFKPISTADSSSVQKRHKRSLTVYIAPDSEIYAVHLERGIE